MKILANFLMIGFLITIASAEQKCYGAPRTPTCSQLRDQGRTGFGCRGGNRWYYNVSTRRCESFDYFGCGGNTNRYCTQNECQRRCHGWRGFLAKVGIQV
ncbi:unnamed protein product [Ceratitis capitata]|uniref:(Mediterranean fruit fly) hypothetical protein n=1 Tax=Ceratitis capitata TaxID=7213 RepID=A0A811UCZ9_CERCA|nr:unnamed protein product [Ceratitis capitata]